MGLQRDRLDTRDLDARRHQVVGEVRGQELAVPVVPDAVEQRPADPLDRRADRLALGQHRVEHPAQLLDHAIVEHRHLAGLDIDRDVRGMRAGAPGDLAPVVEPTGGFERLATGPREGGERPDADGLGRLSAGPFDSPAAPGEALGFGVPAERGEGDAALAERGRGIGDRVARHHRGAAVIAPAAVGQQAGGAVTDRYRVGRHAERIGGDLRHPGLHPLPERGRPDADLDPSALVRADTGMLRRSGRAALDEACDAEAVASAVGADLPLAGTPALVADLVEQAAQRGGVIAVGVGGAGVAGDQLADVEGKLVRAEQIAEPHFRGVQPEVGCHQVDHPLAEKISLEAARPAIGAGRRAVGHHDRGLAGEVRDAVGAGQELDRAYRHDAAIGAGIGAEIGDDLAAQGEDRAVALGRDLQRTHDVARVVGRHQVFLAVLDPFDRAARAAARDRNQVVLGVELAARAEAAADIELDQLDRGVRQAEGPDEDPLVEIRHLGRAPEPEGFPVGEVGDEAPGLQRQGGLAMGSEAFAAAIGRGGEGGFDVAAPDGVADGDVLPRLVVHQRPGLGRGFGIGHRRKGVVIDLYRGKRVLGGVAVGRHDDSDGLAGVARLVGGDRLLQEAVEAREPGETERDLRQRPLEIGAAERVDRARRRARAGKIHRAYPRMGEGASEDRHMGGAGRSEIVDETARPAQEPRVLAPAQRAPDHPLRHTPRRFCIFAARR